MAAIIIYINSLPMCEDIKPLQRIRIQSCEPYCLERLGRGIAGLVTRALVGLESCSIHCIRGTLMFFKKLAEAESQIAQGMPLLDGEEVFKKLRDKYVGKQFQFKVYPALSSRTSQFYPNRICLVGISARLKYRMSWRTYSTCAFLDPGCWASQVLSVGGPLCRQMQLESGQYDASTASRVGHA